MIYGFLNFFVLQKEVLQKVGHERVKLVFVNCVAELQKLK
jgi:hypothetical protein